MVKNQVAGSLLFRKKDDSVPDGWALQKNLRLFFKITCKKHFWRVTYIDEY
jgi:hypothetical protein